MNKHGERLLTLQPNALASKVDDLFSIPSILPLGHSQANAHWSRLSTKTVLLEQVGQACYDDESFGDNHIACV